MPANGPVTILLSAVEPSGDALGAALMRALKKRRDDIAFTGCGGALMAREGLESLFPVEPFAVIGPVGALKAVPAALAGARRLARAAAETNAAAAVLIDSWSFSSLAAKRLRRAAPAAALIKYVAPQVWASRPQRASTLASLFDGVLTLFEFENAWFDGAGVQTRFVGSSTFQAVARADADGAGFRARHGLGASPLLAVLPGSRTGEARRLLGPFGETVRRLVEKSPGLRVVVPVAPAVAPLVREAVAGWAGAPVVVSPEERFGAFAAADAALAASGTVTTELAISGTPMVVGYRVGPATAMWIRSVITTPYVSLINIAGERAVVPEFLQEECQPEKLAAALWPLLAAEDARRAQTDAFGPLLARLGVGGAPAEERAAEAVLQWIDEKAALSG